MERGAERGPIRRRPGGCPRATLPRLRVSALRLRPPPWPWPGHAQDLTQEFFARLIEKNWLADLDPHTGQFRSFILTVLNRFLANEFDRTRAAKRGGGNRVFSLDREQAEGRYRCEPFTDETPERVFDRRWALTVLEMALAQAAGY